MIDETVRDNLLKNNKLEKGKIFPTQSEWGEIATVSWQDTSSEYNH